MTGPRTEEVRTLLPQAMLSDWVRLGSRPARLMESNWGHVSTFHI
jgi:hypothetical protein